MNNETQELKQIWARLKEEVETQSKELKRLEEPLEAQIESLRAVFAKQQTSKLEALRQVSSDFMDVDTELRCRALRHYETTREKSLDGNLGVQVRSAYSYDNGEAVEWAEKNAPIMVNKVIDKSPFEAYIKGLKGERDAKGVTTYKELPFVKATEKVSAVIKGL